MIFASSTINNEIKNTKITKSRAASSVNRFRWLDVQGVWDAWYIRVFLCCKQQSIAADVSLSISSSLINCYFHWWRASTATTRKLHSLCVCVFVAKVYHYVIIIAIAIRLRTRIRLLRRIAVGAADWLDSIWLQVNFVVHSNYPCNKHSIDVLLLWPFTGRLIKTQLQNAIGRSVSLMHKIIPIQNEIDRSHANQCEWHFGNQTSNHLLILMSFVHRFVFHHF